MRPLGGLRVPWVARTVARATCASAAMCAAAAAPAPPPTPLTRGCFIASLSAAGRSGSGSGRKLVGPPMGADTGRPPNAVPDTDPGPPPPPPHLAGAAELPRFGICPPAPAGVDAAAAPAAALAAPAPAAVPEP